MRHFLGIFVAMLLTLPFQANAQNPLEQLLGALSQAANQQATQTNGKVVVNGTALSPSQIDQVSQITGAGITPGNYWYDHQSGLWGYIGGPPQGKIQPHLSQVQGRLSANASGGGTSVYINGRAIHPQEIQRAYQVYGTVIPGRYKMNAKGQLALEGQPYPAQPSPVYSSLNSGSGGGGGSVYSPALGGRSGGTGTGVASDGCTYVMSGNYSNDFCN